MALAYAGRTAAGVPARALGRPSCCNGAYDDLLQAEPPLPATQRPWGVNLIGYAYGQLGIGEDVRT